MKKTLFFAFAALLVASSITSCKKGENDPGLSFRSRKARLAGEWKMVSGEIKTTSIDITGGTTTTTITTTTLTDTQMTESTSVNGGTPTTSTATITEWSFNIDKAGTYKMTQTLADGSNWTSTDITEGEWVFLGKNKTAELKNKEAIALNTTSSSNSFTFGGTTSSSSYTEDGWGSVEIWTIDQLKNKEMILKGTYKHTDGDDGDSETTEYTITFTQE
jgi:hypothetical protein